MTELPYRATTEQACEWLASQTGTPWTLARMLENGLTPYVWLDYDAAFPELFGDANGGYAAPIFFEKDVERLAVGSSDVLITMTKDAYQIVAQLPPPGFVRQLAELRFQKKDLARLVLQLKRDAEPKKEPAPQESALGIGRDQVLAAFGSMVRFDLDKALTEAGGIFGDDGARVKASAKKSKHKAVWNPVTLALGLNEVYRVPVSQLKRAFEKHEFLHPWHQDWTQSLALLGK
ncbi:MAG TPA: hypothetical protein VFT37_12055 [Telluria sp.]|nr:hypothetical protein [Telluria sp.]